MATKYQQKFPIPEKFYDIIHDFAREVLRDQPDDILEYAAQYFEALRDGVQFQFESKYNVKPEHYVPSQYKPKPPQPFDTSKPPARKKVDVPNPETKVKSRPESRQKESAEAKKESSDQGREPTANVYAELDQLEEKRNLTETEEVQQQTEQKVEKKTEQVEQKTEQIEEKAEPNAEDNESKTPINNEEAANIQEPEKESDTRVKGHFLVRIVSARNLTNGTSDPVNAMCKLSFPGSQIVESSVVSENSNPKWNMKSVVNLDIPETEIGDIKVEVFDGDNEDKKLLGSTSISYQDLVNAAGSWAINQLLKLQPNPELGIEDPGEVYLQVKYIPEGLADDNTEPEDIDNVLEKVQGNLQIRVVKANKLPQVTEDMKPHCTIILPNSNYTSKPGEGTNPEWNYKESCPVDLPKDQIAPFKIEIYNQSTLIGWTEITWEDCAGNPSSWAINKVFQLQGGEDIKSQFEDFGEVYVQARFVPNGTEDDGAEPEIVA